MPTRPSASSAFELGAGISGHVRDRRRVLFNRVTAEDDVARTNRAPHKKESQTDWPVYALAGEAGGRARALTLWNASCCEARVVYPTPARQCRRLTFVRSSRNR